MSLGKALKKIVRKNPDSILPALDKALVNQSDVFSWGKARAALELLEESVEIKSLPDLFSAFALVKKVVYGESERSRKFLHASEILHGCERKMFYDLTGVEWSNPNAGKPSPQTQMIFDFGHWIHSHVQMLLWRSGVLEGIEVPFSNKEFRMGGKADGVVRITRRRLLEIKSINTYGFKSLKTAGNSDHVTQASIYAKNLGLSEVHLLYVDKNTCETKEFITPTDLIAVSRVEKTAKLIVRAVKDNTVPDRVCLNDIAAKALTCKYCTTCFKTKY